jgi:hypothetical protein
VIHEFKLSNGQEGSIDIDDMLVNIKGEEWVNEYIKAYVSNLETAANCLPVLPDLRETRHQAKTYKALK